MQLHSLVCSAFEFINAPIYACRSWRWGYYRDMAPNLNYFVMLVSGLVRCRFKPGNSSSVSSTLGRTSHARLTYPGSGRCGWGDNLLYLLEQRAN